MLVEQLRYNLLFRWFVGSTGRCWRRGLARRAFRPKQDKDEEPKGGGRNQDLDFRGQRRGNQTHESRADPEARLWRKSQTAEAKLSYLGPVLGENQRGLIVNVRVTQAYGGAGRQGAVEITRQIPGDTKRVTLGADKGYDTREFVKQLKPLNVTPHVAQNTSGRSSAVGGRTTRHEGYRVSQRRRKLVAEELFGWVKVVAGLRKVNLRRR